MFFNSLEGTARARPIKFQAMTCEKPPLPMVHNASLPCTYVTGQTTVIVLTWLVEPILVHD